VLKALQLSNHDRAALKKNNSVSCHDE